MLFKAVYRTANKHLFFSYTGEEHEEPGGHMLYRVGVLGGVPHFSRPKRRQAPDVGTCLVEGRAMAYAWKGFSMKLSDKEMMQPTRASILSPMLLADWHFL